MSDEVESTFPDMVFALALSPDFDMDRMCLVARSSGLYRSLDGGETWVSAYQSLQITGSPLTTIAAFSPHFAADQTIYAGLNGIILVSNDSSQTWQLIKLPEPAPTLSALAISPGFAQDHTLLVGTMEDGVLISADRGMHWFSWNFGLIDLRVHCLAISPVYAGDGTVFAGTETGIFVSHNGGRSWRETGFPSLAAPVYSLALSTNFARDNTLYAGVEAGLFKSMDQGDTWAQIGADRLPGMIESVQVGIDHRLMILSDGALFYSIDSGITWQGVDSDQGIVSALPVDEYPNSFLVGTENGSVYRI